MKTPRIASCALTFALLPIACLDDKAPADAAEDSTPDVDLDATTDTSADVDPGACGECAAPRLCCPSRFEGDIPRCIDPTLNPEHCGGCGTFCGGACMDSQCIEASECKADGTCDAPLQCGSVAGMGRCCPPGTEFIVSPADFFGCCPDGDICGCRQGMCPISRREVKQEIRYLDPGEVARLGEELLATRLATYRYRGATGERRQLGFIIDDGAPAHGIAEDRAHVDLYGYVSLAVATLQVQAREIDGLRADLEALRAQVEALAADRSR